MNIAFTGHREFKPELLEQPLVESIIELCCRFEEGVTFWCGMAQGFDTAAGEAVIEARLRGVAARLVCVIPFSGHNDKLSPSDSERYQKLLAAAEHTTTLSDHYDQQVFHRRNDYLLANAEMVVAYHNGTKKGGTAYTIRNATRLHIPTINLYPQQQLSLW